MYILCSKKVNMSLLSINGSPEEERDQEILAKSNKNLSHSLLIKVLYATSEKDAPLHQCGPKFQFQTTMIYHPRQAFN